MGQGQRRCRGAERAGVGQGPHGDPVVERPGVAELERAHEVLGERAARRERPLAHRVDLGAIEAGAELVGADVEAVGVSADERLVAEARAARVRRRAVEPVIGGVEAVHPPGSGRVAGRRDRDQLERAAGAGRAGVLHQLGQEEPVRLHVVDALGIRDELPGDTGAAVDLGRQGEELAQSRRAVERVALGVVDGHRVVDGRDHVAVADAERLVGRLEAELGVRVHLGTGEALVTVAQCVEAASARVACGDLVRPRVGGGGRNAGAASGAVRGVFREVLARIGLDGVRAPTGRARPRGRRECRGAELVDGQAHALTRVRPRGRGDRRRQPGGGKGERDERCRSETVRARTPVRLLHV